MQGAFPAPHTSRIDLGDEPPLLTGENRHGPPDRKRVNFRWLAGTVLTGVTSFTLMGVALFAALEGHYTLARTPAPEDIRAATAPRATGAAAILKGDKIVRKQIRAPARRNVIQVSTVRQEGDRNLIRKRPFVLVSSPLSFDVTDKIASVPAFNPVRVFSSETKDPAPVDVAEKIYEADVEGDVAVSHREFPLGQTYASPDNVMTETAVIASIQENSLDLPGVPDFQAYAPVSTRAFSFDENAADAPEDNGVRIVAENMSVIQKRQAHAASTRGYDEEVVPVLKSGNVADVLVERGVSQAVGDAVSVSFVEYHGLESVERGQQLRIAYERPEFAEDESQVIRVSIYDDASHLATVAQADAGAFVSATPPEDIADVWLEDMDQAISISSGGPAPTIYQSIYQTAFDNEVPQELVDELIRIFTFDLDFRSRVGPGDTVEMFFGLDEQGFVGDGPPEVLYAAIEQNGVERKYYRFKSPDDGSVGYYDTDGKSARKFLMRKPMSSGKFRSGFGMRRHPILGYRRMHAGVDWSAPTGTPIMAAGNGVVVEAKWRAGYGRWIKIRHANGYETGYAHQTRFAKGIRKGVRVRQGQVIGYVGSTGLSTGPHLHYEVMVNSRNVNPMRIRLPRGNVLSAEALEGFEKERDRIDSLLDRARNSHRIASN